MRRCGKCQAAFYCSKECQSRDWPVHKQMCGDPGLTKRLPKLIRNLILCPMLLIPLQCCLILTFDLFQRARCDEFLLARVDVAVEPVDIADFADIFSGKGSAM
ncbi:hypothetical protein C8R45DRAFT_999388 [Mycena sanguinolenta]|nr:hypothetical protein C8R45DRAFT_999388 [Mycena sanguinolenta]